MLSSPATPVRAFGEACGLAVMTKSNLVLKSGRQSVGRDQPEHASERLFGVPEVVLLLAAKPEVRCRAREPRQTRGHLGTDRGRSGQNAMERLTCDAKFPGRLADGETKARQNPVTQDPPRMRRSDGERLSGANHDLVLAYSTVALWATGLQKQGLPQI